MELDGFDRVVCPLPPSEAWGGLPERHAAALLNEPPPRQYSNVVVELHVASVRGRQYAALTVHAGASGVRAGDELFLHYGPGYRVHRERRKYRAGWACRRAPRATPDAATIIGRILEEATRSDEALLNISALASSSSSDDDDDHDVEYRPRVRLPSLPRRSPAPRRLPGQHHQRSRPAAQEKGDPEPPPPPAPPPAAPQRASTPPCPPPAPSRPSALPAAVAGATPPGSLDDLTSLRLALRTAEGRPVPRRRGRLYFSRRGALVARLRATLFGVERV